MGGEVSGPLCSMIRAICFSRGPFVVGNTTRNEPKDTQSPEKRRQQWHLAEGGWGRFQSGPDVIIPTPIVQDWEESHLSFQGLAWVKWP